ncbi:MAG: radical SAM family heme chaperone HemW [Bacteroidaceae bacterium]|nr:radical SAM family heme chaperone HemW [Bacteroidaceae bacterium]
MNSIYIHFPFCKSRCIYCDFYSTTLGQEHMAAYVSALKRELHLRRQYIIGTRVHNIYIGGGTPSLLPIPLLHDLFQAISQHYTLADDAEVTIEANPDDINAQWLEGIKGTPVNRISIGAQTFNDNTLRLINRRHNARQITQAVEATHQSGIENISIDLIYGLPDQTLEHWKHDLEQALSLPIKHLSAYSLTYEEGTPLHLMLKRGRVKEADEELSRKMYDHLLSETERAGFLHYEISNFALPDHQSRHNSSYWQSKPYLGLGAGAHSYDGNRTRRANLPDIKAYIAATDDPPHETEHLSDTDLYNEFVMTRLRTSTGIPLNQLSETDRNYCLQQAQPHINQHLLHLQSDHLSLTKQGIFTSNNIICDLMK